MGLKPEENLFMRGAAGNWKTEQGRGGQSLPPPGRQSPANLRLPRTLPLSPKKASVFITASPFTGGDLKGALK